MISLNNVSKRFDNIIAVNSVSFNIENAQRLVISGPSGCGKTTLLRLIAGLEQVDEGEININNKLVSEKKFCLCPSEREIGMVFQDLALWPHMTVMENVSFGLNKVYKDKLRRIGEAHDILKMLHLENKIRNYPYQLSGGEKQRIAIARSLVRRPNILLMDEPFANLNYELKEEMIALMKDITERYEMTLIYVTHDRTIELELATHILHMTNAKTGEVFIKGNDNQQQKVRK